jgi:hypothetical protein
MPYNPRDFLVPATNPKSKQPPEPMHFKAQQGHAHEVAKIICSKRFPYYETTSDVLRHALQRHLEYLHSLGAPINSEWLQTEAIIELVREQMMQQQFESYLTELETVVERSIQMGMKGEGRILVYKIVLLVGQMTDGKWRIRWERELRQRFKFLDDSIVSAEIIGHRMLEEGKNNGSSEMKGIQGIH